jgi:hypothetical protein
MAMRSALGSFHESTQLPTGLRCKHHAVAGNRTCGLSCGDLFFPQASEGWFSGCRCSGASSVALICLLLTLGSFVAPGSQHGLDIPVKHAIRFIGRMRYPK